MGVALALRVDHKVAVDLVSVDSLPDPRTVVDRRRLGKRS